MSTPNTNALAERAMLVSLRQSCWLPGRVDTRVSREVAAAHNVGAKRVVARKYVIDPDTPSYRMVRRTFGDLRTRHYWWTLPWAHYGPRILPAVSFAAYSDDMRALTQRALDAVDTFTAEYPRLATLALAEDTKGLIVATDFPSNIRDCFGIDHQIMPIPTAGDFRVQMSDAEAAMVKAQMQEGVDSQIREALTLAAREPYVRLYKHIERMIERLSTGDATFRDSLVTGLRDLCAMLPALNLTSDAQLDALRDAAERMVAGVDADQLREVPVIRERVCADAKALRDLIAPHVTDNALTAPHSDTVTREAAGIEAAMGSMFNFKGN